MGVGSRILIQLETIARRLGIEYLQLDASLTAKPFYEAHGYAVVERTTHSFRSGGCIDCISMKKELV